MKLFPSLLHVVIGGEGKERKDEEDMEFHVLPV